MCLPRQRYNRAAQAIDTWLFGDVRRKRIKEKRKGLPAPRTRVTSALALLVILFLFAVWLLIFNPPRPPIPVTPTVRPTIPTTSTAHPTNTTTVNTPAADSQPITWVGGEADCNDLVQGEGGHIAFDYSDTNAGLFQGPINIYGSLYVDKANSNHFYGNVVVHTVISAQISDPFKTQGNEYYNNSVFTNITVTGTPADSWPPLYINPDGTILDATFFAPTQGYVQYLRQLSPSMYQAFDENLYGGNTPALVSAIDNYLMTGPRASYSDKGVVYIYSSTPIYPGDLTLSDDKWGNVSLILTGRFDITNASNQICYSNYAGKLSVLANYDYSKVGDKQVSDRCASDVNDWVFRVEGNNIQTKGIIYVPHGQFQVYANTSSGKGKFSGGIVAYSVRLGDKNTNTTANNWEYDFNPTP